jgi:hypothetical protein
MATKQQNPDVILACQIIGSLRDFYRGSADYISLQKVYKDYGKEKVYVIRDKVRITAYDTNGKELGHIETHWNNLAKWHGELLTRKIHTVEGDKKIPAIVYLLA